MTGPDPSPLAPEGESSRRRSPEALWEARLEQQQRELEGLSSKLGLLQGRLEELAGAAQASESTAAEARAILAQLARGARTHRAWTVGMGVALALSLAALAGVLLGAVGPALKGHQAAQAQVAALEGQVAEAKALAEDAKIQLAQLQPRIDQAIKAPQVATAALEGRAEGVLTQAKASLKQGDAAGLDFAKAKAAYQEARRLFELAGSLDPKDPDALLGLGMAQVGLGEVGLAQEAWRRAMELALAANRPDLKEEAMKRLASLGAFTLPLPQKPGASPQASASSKPLEALPLPSLRPEERRRARP